MSDRLVTFLSTAHRSLQKAQIQMEKAIEAYGEACDLRAAAEEAYRKNRATAMIRLKKQGIAVSMLDKLAEGEVADQKAECLKLDGYKEHARMRIEAFKERINSIKWLGRKSEELADGYLDPSWVEDDGQAG